jgi:hypothetical protein
MTRKDITKEELYDLYYNKNMSYLQLSREFGCSISLICKRFKRYGFEPSKNIRTLSKEGKKNPAWISGTIKRHGYVYVKNRTHPFCNAEGYVPEHRLVMEKKLGRHLTQEEIVHHLDFSRTNNNEDNLYLFENKSKHIEYHHLLHNLVGGILNGN